jgi:hypothetical protein
MAAFVALTVGAVTAFAAKPPSRPAPPGQDKPPGHTTPPGQNKPHEGGPRFTISGSVDGLWPGGRRSLVVIADNPYPFDIVLTSLSVTVGDASVACPGSFLHISSLTAEVRIAGGGQRAIELAASLDADAANDCQGATWALSYAASARRA